MQKGHSSRRLVFVQIRSHRWATWKLAVREKGQCVAASAHPVVACLDRADEEALLVTEGNLGNQTPDN